jgi:hypothetical protein
MNTTCRTGLLLVAALLSGCSEGAPGNRAADPGAIDASVAEARAAVAEGRHRIVEAARGAEAAGRPLVVEYFDPRDEACAHMEKETFADPEVKEALGHVTLLRVTPGVDADAFEDRWPEASPPCFAVLDGHGKQRGALLGAALEAGDFLVFLDWVRGEIDEQPKFETATGGCACCGE